MCGWCCCLRVLRGDRRVRRWSVVDADAAAAAGGGNTRFSVKRNNIIQYEDSDLYAKNEPGVGYGPTHLCEVSTRKKVKALLWPDGCLRIRVLMDCPLLAAAAGPAAGRNQSQLLQSPLFNRSIVAKTSTPSSSFSSAVAAGGATAAVISVAARRASAEAGLHAAAAEAAAAARGRRNAIDNSAASFSFSTSSSSSSSASSSLISTARSPAAAGAGAAQAAAAATAPESYTCDSGSSYSTSSSYTNSSSYSYGSCYVDDSSSSKYEGGRGTSLVEEVAAFVRLQGDDCDILFEGETYRANRLLLVSRSKVFAAMLKGYFQEGQQQQSPEEELRFPQQRENSSGVLRRQQQQHQQEPQQEPQRKRRRIVLQLSDASGVTKGALENLLQFIHTDDCALFSATSAAAASASSASSPFPSSSFCSSPCSSSFSTSSASSSFSAFQEAAGREEEAGAPPKEKEGEEAKVKNLLELLIAADLYDVQSAYDRCVEEVISQLSTKNFSSVLLCASRISCKPLIKAARQFANSLSGGTVAAKMLQLLEAVWTAAAASLPPPPSSPAAASLSALSCPAGAAASAASSADSDVAAVAASSFPVPASAAAGLSSRCPSLLAADHSSFPATATAAPSGAATRALPAAPPLTAIACSPRATTDAKRRRLNTTITSNNTKRRSSYMNNCNNVASSRISDAHNCSSNTNNSSTNSSITNRNSSNTTSSCSNSSRNVDSSNNNITDVNSSRTDSSAYTITTSSSSPCSTLMNSSRHTPLHDNSNANNSSRNATRSSGRTSCKGSNAQALHSCCGDSCSHRKILNDQVVTISVLNNNPENTAMPLTCNKSCAYSDCGLSRDRSALSCTSCCSKCATAKLLTCLPCCSCCGRLGRTPGINNCLISNITSAHTHCSCGRNSCDSTSSTPRLRKTNAKAIQGNVASCSNSDTSNSNTSSSGGDAGSSSHSLANSSRSTVTNRTCVVSSSCTSSIRCYHQEGATEASSPVLRRKTDDLSSGVHGDQTNSAGAASVHDSGETSGKNTTSQIGAGVSGALAGRGYGKEEGENAEVTAGRITGEETAGAAPGKNERGTESEVGTNDTAATEESQKGRERVADAVSVVDHAEVEMCQAPPGSTAAQAQETRNCNGSLAAVDDSVAATSATAKNPHFPIACPPVRRTSVASDAPTRKTGAAVAVGPTLLEATGVPRSEEEATTPAGGEHTAPPAGESERQNVTTGDGAVGTKPRGTRLTDAKIPAPQANPLHEDADVKGGGQEGRDLTLADTAAHVEASTEVKPATSARITRSLGGQREQEPNSYSRAHQGRPVRAEEAGCFRHSTGALTTCCYENTCAHSRSEPPLHAAEQAPTPSTESDVFTGRVSPPAAAAANVSDRSSSCCDLLHIQVHGAVLQRAAGRRAEQGKGALQLLHLSLAEAAADDDDDEDCDW